MAKDEILFSLDSWERPQGERENPRAPSPAPVFTSASGTAQPISNRDLTIDTTAQRVLNNNGNPADIDNLPEEAFSDSTGSVSSHSKPSMRHKERISDDDDPIRYDADDDDEDLATPKVSGSGSEFSDSYGNLYGHIDFNAKRYTSRLSFKGTRLVYFTSAFVSLFVSLFGYEQGVCSGILTFVTFNSYFHHPNPTQIGLVISILEIGAMVSSLLVAQILEKFGRKRTILLGTLIFMIGGILQTFSINLWTFGVGRVFSGIGVGILSTMVPSYQCEISPSEERGKLVCVEFTGNISGYALSVWVDYFCYFIQNAGDARKNPHSFAANLSWRLPLLLQVVIALVLFVGGFFIVESPRWLLDVDDDQRGFHVLLLLYDSHHDNEKARKEFFMIKNSILAERIATPKYERSWRHMFRNYRTRVLIACSALGLAQFNGINIISYYAPMVFAEAGFSDSNALLMTGINSIVYLASTVPPWFLVDRWGRKPILVSGALSMCICLSLIALIMYLNRAYTPLLVAVLVIIYNASFGYSWGPIGFLIPPEILPLAVRSKGVSLSTGTNWFANYVVGQLTPILQDSIGWKMYLFPAASCVISVIVVLMFYPEMKGIDLEDINGVFDEFYALKTPWQRIKLMSQSSGGVYQQVQGNKNSYNENSSHNRLNLELELDDFDYELDGLSSPHEQRRML